MAAHVFCWLLVLSICVNHLKSSESYAVTSTANLTKYIKFAKRNTSPNTRESCRKGYIIADNRIDTTDRLRRLRLRMKASSYDAYIIPTNDEHQSEFVADHDKRREFISGFSGSAGTAVVLQDQAALWTDGRYFIQAEQELDCSWLLMKRYEKGTPTIQDWVTKKLAPGSIIGADPKLIPYSQWLKTKEQLAKFSMRLAEDSSNLIDDIWSIGEGRSPESVAHIFIHDIKYAGKSWQEKVKELREKLMERNIDGIIITALDEISWLFNMRSTEVPYTPVFKAYAFVSQEQIRLYIGSLKLTDEIHRYLNSKSCNNSSCVQIKKYSRMFHDISELVKETGKILVSSDSSYAISNLVPKKQREIEEKPSPISVMRTVKNPTEIQGMKNANLKDTVAIVDFVAMLDDQVRNGKHWDEIKASKVLTKFRSEQELNQGESFSTISAFGASGAIIHYSPQSHSSRSIDTSNLYLLDTGGQYLDGTTDITRTFHFGEPNDFQKEAYTRVLMGAINLMNTVFPEGVRDIDLDILARQPLYGIGLDYLHGTGHGIGSFLGVHEAPIAISNPAFGNLKGLALKPGMFMSDEPGYYEAGKFGIRLETVMMVIKANTPHKFNKQEYFTFEPVSLVPFEPKLIKFDLLTKVQKEWLNKYNVKVRNSVGVELRKQKREKGFQWLLSKTEFIAADDCTNRGTGSSVPSKALLLAFNILFLIVGVM